MQWPIETGQKDKQLPTKLYTLRNTMGVTSEAGSSYLFGAPDFNLMFLVSSHCSISKK
jgi:hypothetical protein